MAKASTRRNALIGAAASVLVINGRTAEVQPPSDIKTVEPKWTTPVTTPAQLQTAAASLSSLYLQDKAFKQKLDSDPLKTLNSLGLGKDAVRDLINEDAYLRNKVGDKAGECVATCACSAGCCVSCWVGSTNTKAEAEALIRPPRDFEFGSKDPTIAVNPARNEMLQNIIKNGHITPNLQKTN